MAAVTKRGIGRLFAAAESSSLFAFYCKLQRYKIGPILVGTVTERLILRPAAPAPEVSAGLQFQCNGAARRHNRSVHSIPSNKYWSILP